MAIQSDSMRDERDAMITEYDVPIAFWRLAATKGVIGADDPHLARLEAERAEAVELRRCFVEAIAT